MSHRDYFYFCSWKRGSQFEVYIVILCKHQLLLVFVGEGFYNHQLIP